MAARSLRGARVLLTGASSGIGAALALRLAEQQAETLLTARRAERLEQLATTIAQRGGSAFFHAGDIADAAVREQVIAQAAARWGALDVLINNAGVGLHGPLADADSGDLRRVMEVNFFAPLELTRAALPLLRRGREPLVVNVGSVIGYCAIPGKAQYCASKFALHGLTDAWRAELASEGIDMLLASPSTTASEFFDRVLTHEPGEQRARRGASPSWVAQRIERAMRKRRQEVILSAGGKLLVYADRLAPPLMNRLLARWYRRHTRH